jgi:protein involved in temperature-dependent protein secretion
LGTSISIHPFTPILVDELIRANKIKEAIDLQKKEVDLEPTDIDLFAQLLAQLKKNKMAEYKMYEAKLFDIFRKLKITKKEQDEWLAWIDKGHN